MAKKNTEENNYIGLFFVAIGVFVIAMFFISYYLFNYVEPTTKYFPSYNKIIDNDLSKQLLIQSEVNKEINNALEDNSFTLENPYLKYNPYGMNPLSAIIVFNTLNETSVKLSINGTFVSTFNKGKNHIIPVYGLFANYENEIKLELDDGKNNTYQIVTLPCDDNIKDIDTKKLIKKNENIMFLGNIDNSDSHIRGFDYNGNIVYSLDLSYLSGVKFYNNRIAVKYNSIVTNNTKLPSIKLELDYLGQIYYIYDSTDDLDNLKKYNGLDSYFYTSYNIYDNYENDYKLVDPIDYGKDTVGIEHDLNYYKEDLLNASVYSKKYILATLDDYIIFDFKDPVTLIMVYEDSNIVHEYNLYESSMIKVPRERDASLFIKVDNKYYSLISTLKK